MVIGSLQKALGIALLAGFFYVPTAAASPTSELPVLPVSAQALQLRLEVLKLWDPESEYCYRAPEALETQALEDLQERWQKSTRIGEHTQFSFQGYKFKIVQRF